MRSDCEIRVGASNPAISISTPKQYGFISRIVALCKGRCPRPQRLIREKTKEAGHQTRISQETDILCVLDFRMELSLRSWLLSLLSLALGAYSAAPFEQDCAALATRLNIANTTVYFTQFLAAGSSFATPDTNVTCAGMSLKPSVNVDLCRVAAYTATSNRSGINLKLGCRKIGPADSLAMAMEDSLGVWSPKAVLTLLVTDFSQASHMVIWLIPLLMDLLLSARIVYV